jgi:hypothetical protein
MKRRFSTIDDSFDEDEELEMDKTLNQNKKETWYFKQLV